MFLSSIVALCLLVAFVSFVLGWQACLYKLRTVEKNVDLEARANLCFEPKSVRKYFSDMAQSSMSNKNVRYWNACQVRYAELLAVREFTEKYLEKDTEGR
jgi:hypothetical protein